jgi:hypothetical protein
LAENTFAALGLEPGRDYSDDDIHAAWMRVATATHPDRPGGGDPARYAAGAAAYAQLVTAYGRGEAYADLPASQAAEDRAVNTAAAEQTAGPLRRARAGRPWFLLVRVLVVALVCWGCTTAAGWQPATLALTVGALTWLALTARYDLA